MKQITLILKPVVLDLNLFVSNDIFSTKMYDKCDDFDFEIVSSPF